MNEILRKENIIVNASFSSKKEVLTKIACILKGSGYVTEHYRDALFEKEKVFNTCIGFGLAIPHGIESMSNEIKASGIVIIAIPEGIDWGDNKIAKLVVGIAGLGNEHMEILSNIAANCCSEEEVTKLANSTVDEIYEKFV